jgi:hypothetical protein
VLLVSLRRAYEISRPDEIASRRQELTEDLDDFSNQVAKYRRRAISGAQIKGTLDDYRIYSGSHSPLDVDVKQFREFATSLKNIEMEKWVLVFCQRNLALFSKSSFITSTRYDYTITEGADGRGNVIPLGPNPERMRTVGSLFGFIMAQGSGRQPLEKFKKAEMEKMFIQSGASFHLLVLASKNKDILLSEQAHYEELQTGWQDVFAAISSATGGTVLQDGDMTGALQNFSRQQDIYYILTFEPSEKKQLKRKIKLELLGKNHDLFYDNEGMQRHIGKFAISGMEWQEPVLRLKVENYLPDLQPQGIGGHVSLTIHAVPEQGEEMTFARELLLPEKKPDIQLKLRFPAKGRYHLSIEAVDQLGRDTASAELKISWRGSPAPAKKPEKTVGEIIDNERD